MARTPCDRCGSAACVDRCADHPAGRVEVTIDVSIGIAFAGADDTGDRLIARAGAPCTPASRVAEHGPVPRGPGARRLTPALAAVGSQADLGPVDAPVARAGARATVVRCWWEGSCVVERDGVEGAAGRRSNAFRWVLEQVDDMRSTSTRPSTATVLVHLVLIFPTELRLSLVSL
jgi:hypothetical protein